MNRSETVKQAASGAAFIVLSTLVPDAEPGQAMDLGVKVSLTFPEHIEDDDVIYYAAGMGAHAALQVYVANHAAPPTLELPAAFQLAMRE